MEMPTKIDLRVGEIYTLRLPGLGTAGYIWTYEFVENDDLVDVSARTVEGLRLGAGDQSTSVGSSRDALFTIRALETGHSTIRFTHKRAWECNERPLKERIIEVFVNK